MTALEFGLIAPVFLGLVFMVLEVAFLVFTQNVLCSATTAAARLIQTGQVQAAEQANQGGGQTQFQGALCTNFGSALLNCSKLMWSVQISSNFGGAHTLQTAPSSSSFNPGGPGDVVLVQVFYTGTPIVPLVGHLMFPAGDPVLSSALLFRNGSYQ